MMDKEALTNALQTGQMDIARKELTRYGTIIDTADREDNTGAHRVQTIIHHGSRYIITMHNGRVLSIAWHTEIFYPTA